MQNNSNSTSTDRSVQRNSKRHALDLLLLACLRPHRFASNLWWRLLGKRLRARLQMDAAIRGLPFGHLRRARSFGTEDLDQISAAMEAGPVPSFCVHIHHSRKDNTEDTRKALRSVLRQSYAPVKLLVTHEAGAPPPDADSDAITILSDECSSWIDGLQAALKIAGEMGAQWLVPLDPASRLPEYALAAYGAHILCRSDNLAPVLLYGDEREIGRLHSNPKLWLKPQWDRRMALSQNFVGPSCALAVEPARAALSLDGEAKPQSLHELVLRITDGAHAQHVCRVTALTPSDNWHSDGENSVAAVRRVMGKIAGEISPGPFGTVSMQYPLPDPAPTVTVVIATRDRVDLLRTCVEGVLGATNYPALDVIIADNESVEPETLRYIELVSADPRVSVVRWPHPFNYSAINNFAADHARGEYLCLLNNDIEVIEPNWLSAMMREAIQPGIGAVGARLLYPDFSIQHAGVAIGIGNAAGHAHRALPQGDAGYYAQALIARGASAVTGACLLVARRDFEAVGGLDEECFSVAYNDVDLCLKLRELGLKNIYTPLATLIHHESKSRGLDFAPEHLERYMRELKVLQDRWDTQRVVDPWHHPELDRDKESYE